MDTFLKEGPMILIHFMINLKSIITKIASGSIDLYDGAIEEGGKKIGSAIATFIPPPKNHKTLDQDLRAADLQKVNAYAFV
jgi:hypothetical protein